MKKVLFAAILAAPLTAMAAGGDLAGVCSMKAEKTAKKSDLLKIAKIKEAKAKEIAMNEVKGTKITKGGIETEDGKKITKLIKESKLKVQASIQGDTVRVSGAKKDDLQSAIQLVRQSVADLPLQFINFRD